MAAVVVDPEKIRAFPSEAHFETWLRKNHARELEVWILIHKKASGLPTVTPAQAIDVALCWGWIDGLRKPHDETSFLQRYTPRRKKSIWSQINRDNVARLVAAGRMQPPGQAQVEAAHADGRWQEAYASPRNMTLPADFLAAVERSPAAQKTLEALDKTNRFALGFRLQRLKTAAARERAIERYVALLARGEAIHPIAKPTPARAKTVAVAPTVEKKTKPAQRRKVEQRTPVAKRKRRSSRTTRAR